MPKYDKKQVSLQDVYKFYTKQVEDPVTYKEHKEILEVWGDVMSEFLVLGKDVKLHNGLSTLGVRKYKKATYVDYVESKKQGRRVLKPNSHSGFYAARVYWRRHYTRVFSINWEFKPCRKLSSALAEAMKVPQGHTNYVQRAMVTRKKSQTKKRFNKKVHKL